MQTNQSTYWEVLFSCPIEQSELIQFYFFENDALGIEELQSYNQIVLFKSFFNHKIDTHFIDEISDVSLITIEEKPIENWQDNWKENFKPIYIANRYCVRPPWEEAASKYKNIVIMPGMGFGTGFHESTNLALQNLALLCKQDSLGRVLDIGAGSGILSIAALHEKASFVTALEIDELAISEITNNCVLSGFPSEAIEVIHGSTEKIQQQYHTILANITGDVLLTLVDSIKSLLEPKGYVILSGITQTYLQDLLNAFSSFSVNHILQDTMWHSLLLQYN